MSTPQEDPNATPPAYTPEPGYATAPVPPPYTPAPGGPEGPDSRPRGLGWVALGLGVAAFVLAFVSLFVLAMPESAIVLGVIAGLLGLVGLILAIVVLASRKQGNKGAGVAALIASLIGGGLSFVPLVISTVLLVVPALEGPSSPTPLASPSASSPAPGTSTGAQGDEAFLEEVRPQIQELLSEIDPGLSDSLYSDADLLSIGKPFADFTPEMLEAARGPFMNAAASSSQGIMTEEQAGRFFDVITAAAQRHL